MDRLKADMSNTTPSSTTWEEDCTLCNSEIMLQTGLAEREHDCSSDPTKPLIAVVDGRGRFRLEQGGAVAALEKGRGALNDKNVEGASGAHAQSGADAIVAG